MHMRFHLQHVGKDVAVRKDHTLGVSRRSRGEDHRGDRVQVWPRQPRDQPLQYAKPEQTRSGQSRQLVAPANLTGNLFKHQQVGIGSDLEPLEHSGRGDDVADAALLDRRIDDAWTGRVVQVDRDLSLKDERQVGHGGGNSGWKQHAHIGIGRDHSCQATSQHDGAQQGISVGQLSAGPIAHRLVGPVPSNLADKRVS